MVGTMDRIYRLQQHLMPPSGWMNDPNGFCYYEGWYHVFFQYAPKEPRGFTRYWGHYRSQNLLTWYYEGIAIKSDCEWDKNGAFSGCGFTEDGKLEIFYTGNVEEEGDYDYVYEGRGANVIYTVTEDGLHFSDKKLLLTNEDYPKEYTCHVRDPKVWKTKNLYYMILGGRKKDNTGAVLQYVSSDKKKWDCLGELCCADVFGFMWECPDAFEIGGKTIIACCPQGVAREECKFQNPHAAGYFFTENCKKENLSGICKASMFREWDYGFDFYAPQTMEDPKGRRLLIGWAGVPDMEPEYHNEPIIKEGWQHSLTSIRELSWKNDRIYQYPVKEYYELRKREHMLNPEMAQIPYASFDLEIDFRKDAVNKQIQWNEDILLGWENGVFFIKFLNDTGCGRDIRRVAVKECNHIRMIKDVSYAEVYINYGEAVMTTRYYPRNPQENLMSIQGAEIVKSWELKKMEVYNMKEE